MSIENETKKKNLLSDENFDLLRQCQMKIQDITDFSPSIRMIINNLINEESIQKVTDNIINKMSKI